ncbi:MAG: hypothetical protein ACR2PL_24280 [Dehalococcoidia bacterium]
MARRTARRRTSKAYANTVEGALQNAIDQLYAVFRRYPLRPYTEPCPHCLEGGSIPLDAEARLHSKPLRALQGTDLKRYTSDALYTWGEVDDFRHFLPRILELMALGELELLDLEMILAKLPYAEWRQWPGAEQSAIESFLLAHWRRLLTTDPFAQTHGTYRSREWLSGIAMAVDDLTPYLDSWRKNQTLPALLHLADFVWDESGLLGPKRQPNAFLEDRPGQVQQIAEWLRAPETLQSLKSLQEAPLTDDATYELERAILILETAS